MKFSSVQQNRTSSPNETSGTKTYHQLRCQSADQLHRSFITASMFYLWTVSTEWRSVSKYQIYCFALSWPTAWMFAFHHFNDIQIMFCRKEEKKIYNRNANRPHSSLWPILCRTEHTSSTLVWHGIGHWQQTETNRNVFTCNLWLWGRRRYLGIFKRYRLPRSTL